jgi:2-keto-3-deoxy-L-rhamnonate aldolase RhmA
MLTACWVHGEVWTIDKFKKRTHKTDEGWCNWNDVLKPITVEICTAKGLDALALNEKCRAKYEGRTWSKITEPEQLAMLEGLL